VQSQVNHRQHSYDDSNHTGTSIPGSPPKELQYHTNKSLPVMPSPLVPSYAYDQNHQSGMSHRDADHVTIPVKESASRIYHSDHQRSAPRPSKSSSSIASDTKPKLPHGLTVHELKEMTKARLHAEATETRDILSPEPLGSVPSIVRPSPDFRDTHVASPTMLAPIMPPPNFGHNLRSPYQGERNTRSPYQESWSHDSRNDLWENGSVSTQTSDYIGSEQAFGVASLNDNESGFNRARSFSANSGIGLPPEFGPSRDFASPAMGQSQSTSYLDTGSCFVPNRRRAATLSPRVGLSHLHEHRQVLPGQELPGLPSFHVPNFAPTVAPRNGMNAFMPSDQFRHHQSAGAGLIGGTPIEANRIRTSSVVSLPAMSHTAEEFAIENQSRLSHFSALPEHRPVSGLSDVFREPPRLGGVHAPPGFIDGPELRVHQTSSAVGIGSIDSFSEPRGRASTWGETSCISDLFGPGLFAASHEDTLSDDLASILKLSGAEERFLNSPPPGLL
jgi:hypothetical protein